MTWECPKSTFRHKGHSITRSEIVSLLLGFLYIVFVVLARAALLE